MLLTTFLLYQRDERRVALADGACRSRSAGCSWWWMALLSRQSAEDRRRRLAPIDALRPFCSSSWWPGAGARMPCAPRWSRLPMRRRNSRRNSQAGAIPRVDGTTVFLTRSIRSFAAGHRSRAIRGRAAATCHHAQRRFRGHAALVGPNCAVIDTDRGRAVARRGALRVHRDSGPAARAETGPGHSTRPSISTAPSSSRRAISWCTPGSRAVRGARLALFAFLYRNAVKIVDRFNLPPQNVVEIARQVEI